MRVSPFAALLIATAALAGCITEDPGTAGDDLDMERTVLHQDENITLEEVTQTLWEPNLLEAPPWHSNMWWKIEMHDEFTQEDTTNYRIVTGAEGGEGGNYLVGMPTHGFSNTLMVLHIPGFGQVDKQTLGYELHDCQMDMLQFPLEEGKSWETEFECQPITITVLDVTETTADLVFAPTGGGGGNSGTIHYDAEARAVTEFVVNNYGTYIVSDYGDTFHEDVPEWDGQVTVPYSHDLIFMHGRIAGVVPNGFGDATGGPLDSQEVSADYGRVSFAIILGDILGLLTGNQDLTAAGVYQETAIAPDGETYQLQHAGPGLVAEAYKNDNPTGTWNFQHIAAGPGIAMAEGIAYKVFDVQMPGGNVIETAGEHEHEDGQGHGAGGNATASR